MPQSFSYAFTPITSNDGTVILRPLLIVLLNKDGQQFGTTLLLDSGADYSMLRRDVAQEGLGIDLNSLSQEGTTYGIVGATPVGIVDIIVIFGVGNKLREETIPFRISLDPDKDPPENILGRDPFFYRYRIDFRMGYTDDPSLGKFWFMPEEKKRKSKDYKRPRGFRK